jgi:hypothetical protein
MGEAKRKRQARLKEYDCDVEEAPVLRGHLRLTIVDDDDAGCSVYYPVDKVAELLDAAGKLTRNGRTLVEVGADPAAWARLRNAAFDKACNRSEREAAGTLMLWAVMNGPPGPHVRRQVSSVLAEHGHAVIVTKRDRKTEYVATTVGEEAAVLPTELVRESARHLPDGMFVYVGDDERRREDA